MGAGVGARAIGSCQQRIALPVWRSPAETPSPLPYLIFSIFGIRLPPFSSPCCPQVDIALLIARYLWGCLRMWLLRLRLNPFDVAAIRGHLMPLCSGLSYVAPRFPDCLDHRSQHIG